jgi:hypothetical protein
MTDGADHAPGDQPPKSQRPDPQSARGGPGPRWLWPALIAACATMAMRDVFTLSGIIYTRDLSFFYWPHHLWLRSKLLAGTFPLWDPYVGLGQSAIADPIRQMLFPPTLLLRLLPPVIGFNLIVALPVLVATLGAYLLLKPHASSAGASLGAIVFGLSGPVLSTANSPNMEWSLALGACAIAAVDRLAARPSTLGLSLLAVLFALQALAGETVTFFGFIALAVLYGAFVAVAPPVGWRGRAKIVLLTAVAWMLGLMLAAPQLLPLFRAARLSGRGTQVLPDVLSLHPLALAETVAWPLFGDWFEPWGVNDPWTQGLYGLYTSVYLGIGALALALVGALSPGKLRWRAFWCLVAVVSLLLALGRYTPVHQAFLAVFPPGRTFRYPAKYAIFGVMAVGALAATGWDALLEGDGRRRRRALTLASAFALAVAVTAVFGVAALAYQPAASLESLMRLARAAGLIDAVAGAAYLVDSMRAALPRTAALATIAAAALWMTRRRYAARWALFALVVVDLLTTNGGLNPTVDAALLEEPAWVAATRAHPQDRTYIGGRLSWLFDLTDPDDPGVGASPPRDAPRAVVSSVYAAMFATFPSTWAVREAASANLSFLWPLEYTVMMRNLVNSGREGRTRFLRRVGVRYFLLPRPPQPAARPLLLLPRFNNAGLYEIADPVPRASVVKSYTVVPDVDSQIALMFDGRFDPTRQVLLQAEPPPPAGIEGPTQEPLLAAIEHDGLDSVLVRVKVPEGGGFHVLTDSYDRNWEAEVDGKRAFVLRANGLFRAVRLAGGDHEVRWTYRTRDMRAGFVLAAATALGLLAANFFLEAPARPQ